MSVKYHLITELFCLKVDERESGLMEVDADGGPSTPEDDPPYQPTREDEEEAEQTLRDNGFDYSGINEDGELNEWELNRDAAACDDDSDSDWPGPESDNFPRHHMAVDRKHSRARATSNEDLKYFGDRLCIGDFTARSYLKKIGKYSFRGFGMRNLK